MNGDEPELIGQVVEVGDITDTDGFPVTGIIVEIDPTSLRDFPKNLLYQSVTVRLAELEKKP